MQQMQKFPPIDMKDNSIIIKPFVSKCVYFALFIFIPLLLFLSQHHNSSIAMITKVITKNQSTSNNEQLNTFPGLKIRPGYKSYDSYIQRQLNKTLNPKLRQLWKTRDWTRKIQVFSSFFDDLKNKKLLFKDSKALCIGARMGQEVEALRRVGVSDSIGMDLVPSPPLVIRGDFHSQPFDNETFDFEFSNVFDHALYPDKFVGEIERTLKPGGVCVIHVAISKRADKYSANDLYSVEPLKKLFKRSGLVHVRTVDGFGLDTEVVFRKRKGS